MDIKSLKVKEVLADERLVAIIKELAPNLLKYPVKLLGNKSVGDIFELATSKGIVPADIAKQIMDKFSAVLDNK